jgi:hypothetical protein
MPTPDEIAQQVRQAVKRTHEIDTPVPHISDPSNFPLHMSQGISSGEHHTVGFDNNPAVGKYGSNRFIAHESDLLGPTGKRLPVVPVYSDSMSTGRIILPFSGRMFETHGGGGFGSHSRRYGDMGWAMLHSPASGYQTAAKGVHDWENAVLPLAREHGGVIGAIWKGTSDSHLGNVAVMHAMIHELQWLHENDPKRYASIQRGFAKMPGWYNAKAIIEHLGSNGNNRWPNMESFLRHYSGEHTSCGQRYEIMTQLAGKQIKPADFGNKRNIRDDDGFHFTDFVQRIKDSLTDYKHIPKGHVFGLVKFDGRPSRFEADAHPAYKWIFPGSYLGELQHTVPLADLIPQIRLGPISNGKYIMDTFVMHNPYHPELVTDPHSLTRGGVSKAINIGKQAMHEMEPGLVNAWLATKILKPHLQLRAYNVLRNAVEKNNG